MSGGDIIEAIIKSLIILLLLLTAFAYMTLYERRLVGRGHRVSIVADVRRSRM